MSHKYIIAFFFFFILTTQISLASTTDDTISQTNSYAYAENVGWIDFAT